MRKGREFILAAVTPRFPIKHGGRAKVTFTCPLPFVELKSSWVHWRPQLATNEQSSSGIVFLIALLCRVKKF